MFYSSATLSVPPITLTKTTPDNIKKEAVVSSSDSDSDGLDLSQVVTATGVPESNNKRLVQLVYS